MDGWRIELEKKKTREHKEKRANCAKKEKGKKRVMQPFWGLIEIIQRAKTRPTIANCARLGIVRTEVGLCCKDVRPY